jgi:hypothetical protein
VDGDALKRLRLPTEAKREPPGARAVRGECALAVEARAIGDFLANPTAILSGALYYCREPDAADGGDSVFPQVDASIAAHAFALGISEGDVFTNIMARHLGIDLGQEPGFAPVTFGPAERARIARKLYDLIPAQHRLVARATLDNVMDAFRSADIPDVGILLREGERIFSARLLRIYRLRRERRWLERVAGKRRGRGRVGNVE